MIGGLRVRDQSRAGGDGSCSADGWLGGEGQIKIGLWALGRLLQGLDGRLFLHCFAWCWAFLAPQLVATISVLPCKACSSLLPVTVGTAKETENAAPGDEYNT